MSAGRAFRRKLRSLRGGVLQLVPELQEGMPPELLNAIARRRDASRTGVCACGAEFEFDGPLEAGKVVHAAMVHAPDCPASDEGLTKIAERHGWPL